MAGLGRKLTTMDRKTIDCLCHFETIGSLKLGAIRAAKWSCAMLEQVALPSVRIYLTAH